MPSILSRLQKPVSGPVREGPKATGISVSSPVARPTPPVQPILSPVLNSVLRGTLFNLGTASPDNLRQFYQGGMIPQYRLNPAPLLS